MKLYVSEKLFSFHNKFYVKDENDVDVYEISSKVISIGDKTTISDMCGNQIIYIEQDVFHLTPHYNIYINNVPAFQIARKFQIFKNDYTLSNGYTVVGDFFMFDFVIYDENNNQVGMIKRKYFTIGDKYEITIDDVSKKETILAIIVAITNDINRSQRSSSNN